MVMTMTGMRIFDEMLLVKIMMFFGLFQGATPTTWIIAHRNGLGNRSPV